MPAELLCHRRRSAGAEEGVQHDASGRAACQQTGFRQLWRESGEMPTPVRHGVDLPYVALVAKLWNICIRIGSGSSWQIDFLDILLSGNAASVLGSRASCAFHAPYCRFRNRLRDGGSIVIVAAGLGQQENMLIAAAWPVLGAFRHGVRFHPDDVRAQIPAV